MRMTIYKMAMLAATISLGPTLQAQDYEGYIGWNFMLKDSIDASKGYCLDLEGYAFITDTSAPVIVHSCKEGFFKDGTWMVDYPQPGQIYLPDYELCVAAESLQEGANVILQTCSDAPLQHFVFRDDEKVELTSDSPEKYCLAVGENSRPTGGNLRRETRIVSCDDTDEQYTQWILPREDTVYPAIVYERIVGGQAGARGGAMGRGMGAAMGGGMGGGAGNNLYVGACSPCHGVSGEGHESEFSPKISGQEDWYLTRQLANYIKDVRGDHDGERWAMQMNFHVKDFTQAQLTSFVEYIGTLEDTPAEVTIEGDTTRGKQLYTQTCVACHGEDGMGIPTLNSPRLAGLSDWYMVIQLQKFRNGFRGDHPEDTLGLQMVAFSKTLPDEQALLDVVSYINTLPTP
jgi:cytochrome c553